ncbi:MAG TPA: phosphotransferase [Chloroflexia bacterium]|nr:phosphotransferase [Chloroflexia bacterium]
MLLQETVARYVDPVAQIAQVQELSVDSGLSGAIVKRYVLTLQGVADESSVVRLVTKNASLKERRTLVHLGAQGQPNVPFSHTLDLNSDAPALICMQDVGSIQRPTSLEYISEVAVDREAAAVAAIHAANWGRADLNWLPVADRAYYTRMIETVAWRPNWERAIADRQFCELFRQDLPRVEAAAASIVDEMSALYDEGDALTLVHTDINPSNVLLLDGVPYIIDWQSTHYGPFYLDVPHHFFSQDLAERYRVALAEHGITVSPADFAQRFRIAARYTALRYMWWTFDAWREDPSMEVWVRHYFSMI